MHLVLEVLVRWHVRHVEAVAFSVELPAVIDAADAALLVAPEEQRCATMRAAVIHDADATRRIAKADQLLAQQHQADGIAVGLELRRQRRRNPILAHELAHRRAGADVHQLIAILVGSH
jgi:hypothetical protein